MMNPLRRCAVALALGGLCFLVYVGNLRPATTWDSLPTRLLPFSLLRQGNLDLDEFAWLRQPAVPYFLKQSRGGHWMSKYPVATPVLITPLYLPAVAWLRAHHVDDQRVAFRLVAAVMDRVGAAAITAASVALLFLALCAITSPGWAAAVAVGYAFATSTWVISSQTLWQHASAELSLAGLSLCLLQPPSLWMAAGAAIFATYGAMARPTMVIFAVVATVFVMRHRRSWLPIFILPALAGATVLLLYNLGSLGGVRGGYRSLPETPSLERTFGLLFSANRGLLVFSPVVALAIPPMFRWRRLQPPWIVYAAAGIGLYLLFYSSFHYWWAGETYGPRFLVDILPAAALLGADTAQRLWRSAAGRALLVVLLVWSVGVQAIGVYFDANSWNRTPITIDRAPERAWQWGDWQVLRAARDGWHGTQLAPLLWQVFTRPEPAYLRPLREAELDGRVELAAPQSTPMTLHRGQGSQLRLLLTNQGTASWPAFSDYGYLQVEVVAVIADEVAVTMLPKNLGAGDQIDLTAAIPPPSRRGSAELIFRVVQVRSIDQGAFGNAELRLPVEVR